MAGAERQAAGPIRSDATADSRSPAPPLAGAVLRLQRSAGNRAVAAALATSAAAPVQRDDRIRSGEGIGGATVAGGRGRAEFAVPTGRDGAGPGSPHQVNQPVGIWEQGPAVEELQHRLRALYGSDVPLDGHMAEPTMAALRRFQRTVHLEPTGEADQQTWTFLRALSPRSDVVHHASAGGERAVEGDAGVRTSNVGYTTRITRPFGARALEEGSPYAARCTIEVGITFVGDPGGVADRFVGDIERTWNQGFHARNERGQLVPIRFQVVRGGDDFTVHLIASGRSDTTHWARDDTSGTLAPHEFGHMLGLEDEYRRRHDDIVRLTGRAPQAAPRSTRAATTPAPPADVLAGQLQAALHAEGTPLTRATAVAGLLTASNVVQGPYAQAVATSYQRRFAVDLVDEIVARTDPSRSPWLTDAFLWSTRSVMGGQHADSPAGNPSQQGAVDHDHPVETRHLRRFLPDIANAIPGRWELGQDPRLVRSWDS